MRKLLHSNFCGSSIRPGSGTRGLGTLFLTEKRDRFSMGAWFKSCLRLPNAAGALDVRISVGVFALYAFQAVRSGIVLTTISNSRPLEEAVCSSGLHRR